MELNKMLSEIGNLLLSNFHSLDQINITLKVSKEDIGKINTVLYEQMQTMTIAYPGGLAMDIAQGKKQITKIRFGFPVAIQIELIDKDETLVDTIINHTKSF